MNIGYCVQGYPVKSQTWIPLEIQELERRGHTVEVIDIEKPLNPKIIKSRDFIVCHFSYQGIYARRWGIPYGIIAHAYDIWKDNGNALKLATKSKNCKWVGYISKYHKNKYEEWGIDVPLTYTPVCCDTEFFKKKKSTLGDTIICGGRNTEKKGIKYALEGFPDIYQYGGKNWLTKEEYRDLMDNSWLMVSPNIVAKDGDMDGQPTNIKEAMLMELQILTTDIAGTKELKYVHIKDVNDIRKGDISNISKINNIKGRDFIRKNYSPEKCVDYILGGIE